VIKSKRVVWAGHVAYIREMRNIRVYQNVPGLAL
jgi:hypothetical protein